MTNTLYIFGAGGFAREVMMHYQASFYQVKLVADVVSGNEPIAPISVQDATVPGVWVVAVGDPKARRQIVGRLGDVDYTVLSLTNPYPFGTTIGEGTIICPGAIITCSVTIGRHVQANLNATVGHDCTIGDFTTIAPGAHISGNVTIGSGVYVGTGATIREGVRICDDVVIGMNAAVIRDILEPGVYVGSPAVKKTNL